MHGILRLPASAAAGVAVAGVPVGASAKGSPTAAGEPPPVVEDCTCPGAAEFGGTEGIRLLRGDGRITLARCDSGGSGLIKVEGVTRGFRIGVEGGAGRPSPRVEGVFPVGAGGRNVAATAEGPERTLDVSARAAGPVMAADPARTGAVVAPRASRG